MDIHVLHRQGQSIRAIANKKQLSRNTVRKYLRDSSLLPSYSKSVTRPSKLDPFKPYLLERIAAAKPYWIPATVLYREIRELGFKGKEGIVKIYIRPFKPHQFEPIVRFETAPGEQLQIDFTTIRRGPIKLKAFVATLGYSRTTYVRFSEHERQQDWLQGIELALNYFAGVPKELLFDNAKCIMIERDGYGQGLHRWNPKLLEMAKDYGFRLKACRPYRAKTKGKVERFNGYLKTSFITPLATSLKQAGLVLDVDTANAHIGPWLHDVANQRIHGTTGEKPIVLLEKERFSLQPLLTSSKQQPKEQHHTKHFAVPVESLQHPLSVYDQLLGLSL